MTEYEKKLVSVGTLKKGDTIIIDGAPCKITDTATSRPRKHGHAKVRVEAVNMFTDSKKVFVIPGHDRFEVPMVLKKKGQILSVGEKMSVMDLESFETFEMECPEDLKHEIVENSNVEYWDVEGKLIVKRKI